MAHDFNLFSEKGFLFGLAELLLLDIMHNWIIPRPTHADTNLQVSHNSLPLVSWVSKSQPSLINFMVQLEIDNRQIHFIWPNDVILQRRNINDGEIDDRILQLVLFLVLKIEEELLIKNGVRSFLFNFSAVNCLPAHVHLNDSVDCPFFPSEKWSLKRFYWDQIVCLFY